MEYYPNIAANIGKGDSIRQPFSDPRNLKGSDFIVHVLLRQE
jgi:hypothetical protein